MDPRSFSQPQRRHVRRVEGGYDAFLPPPLPPQVSFDDELVSVLSDAERALGKLAGFAETLPNPHLVTRSLIRNEAVLSSRIEGSQASLTDLVLYEVSHEDPTQDAQEVLNYVTAIEHVLNANRRLPLSLSLLREAHAILMRGVRGGYANPGEFRRTQNWIGRPGSTLSTATYVPPPPPEMWDCLDALEKFLHGQHTTSTLVVISYAHYQFEAIHPFIDGNGRIGRLLVAMLLVEWGILPAPLLDLSAYVEHRRDEYYASLLAVSQKGDWVGWLRFFLGAMAAQAGDAAVRARNLLRLREDYRERVLSSRTSGSVQLLIDALFEIPAVTVARVQKVLGLSHRAAMANILKLRDAGIVVESRATERPRVFVARELLQVVGS